MGIDSLTGLATSALGGGLFGVLGTAAGRVAGYFEKKQSFAQEEKRWSHELRLIDAQSKAKAEETEREIDLADVSGAWSGLSASYEAEAGIGDSYKWVNAVRALTRPVLTLLLWIITAAVFFAAGDAGTAQQIAETITFAATAATLWWFGDRAVVGKRG